MELFSAGNIITMLVCIAALVIFRISERRSRGIDLLRNYAQEVKNKLKDELNNFVERKTRDIKDLGAQIATQKNVSLAILANLAEKQSELEKNAASFDEVNKIARDYKSAIEQLFKMTESVEANLSRIQEESPFVENALSKVESVQKEIEVLVTGTMEDIKREEAERVAAVKRDRELIETMLKDSVNNAGEKAGKLEGEIYDAFRKRTEERTEKIQSETAERLEKIQSETEERLAELEGGVNELNGMKARLEEVRGSIEELKREVYENSTEKLEAFSGEMSTSLEEKKKDITERFNIKLAEISAALQNLNEESDKEAERRGIEFEERLSRRIAELDSTFAQKTAEFESNSVARLEKAKTETQNFIEDLSRRILDMEAANKSAIQKYNDAFDSAMSKSSALEDKINASEKKLESFFEEAKLVHKAEEMKDSLSKQIAEMSASINMLEEQKETISNIENQFERIKRMELDINGKMTRFLSEQHRIDFMEGEFKKLIDLSSSIENKIASLRESENTVQDMQIEFRKIGASLKEIEEKYERLEKKGPLLDTTNEAVDTNFKTLQESEKSAKEIEGALSRMTAQLEEVKGAIENLIKENARALETSEKLGELDSALKEIEGRIEDMQKARVWLSELETRMNEVNREAHAAIKELVKGGRSANPVDLIFGKGSPSPAARDNIIKLKRQGWSTDEIAKSLKIAKSAVELVLETAPRNNS